MNPSPSSEESLFQAALRLSGAARQLFLEQACADQPALKARLHSLLDAHDHADGLLATADLLTTPTLPLPKLAPNPNPNPKPSPDAAVGLSLGRYRLLEKLGEGGCGVVYVAEQTEPVRRRVALKLIKPGMDSRQILARFEAERQALALMDHPNIARILDAGTTADSSPADARNPWTGDRPFFVMELVRGIRITDYCDQNHLGLPERLDLFIQVCHAIQHAHQKGIIHRDIKPSNILVTLHDGRPVPKVIDFGIAKATEGKLTEATVYTQLHQFIGTPAYMSPEQAEMSALDIDTRSDIYSLGVLLYELLTGVTPFDGKELLASGIDGIRKTIREQEPPRPSTRLTQLRASALSRKLHIPHATLPADLDWIVMKCLEKDRARRYETANGLAVDLRRHLHNEPVAARPPSTAYRLQKAFRRNRPAFMAAALVALALIAGLSISTWQAVRASRAEQAERLQAQLARTERDRATLAEREASQQATLARQALRHALRNAYVAEINAAHQALSANNLGWARELLARQIPSQPAEDLRGFEWRHLWAMCRDDTSQPLVPGGPSFSVRYSPDGRILAVPGAGILRILDARSKDTNAVLPVEVRCLSFSRDGETLVTSHESAVELWRTSDWQLVRRVEGAGYPAVISPDGRWLAAKGTNGFRVWDTQSWQVVGDCPGEPQMVWSSRAVVCFSPDSRTLLTVAGDRFPMGDHIRQWEIPSLRRLSDLRDASTEPSSASFSADGSLLATGTWDGRILLWDRHSGRILASRQEHTGCVTALSLSADGKTLASASVDRTLLIWDVPGLEVRRRFRGHVGEIWSMDLSPNGLELVSSSMDQTTRLWRVEERREQPRLEGDLSVAGFTEGGNSVVAVGTNRLVMWTPRNGDRLDLPMDSPVPHLFTGHFGSPCRVTPDGQGLVRGRIDGVVEVRNLPTGIRRAEWAAHADAISTLTFSPDGRILITAGANGEVCVWDYAERAVKARISTGDPSPYCIAMAPTGTRIAISSQAGRIWLWDWVTGTRSRLEGADQEVFAVAFSPDGRTVLATTQQSNVALVWDAETGSRVSRLQGHLGGLTSLAFSPDGRTLATVGGDRRVKLWSVASYQPLATYQSHNPLSTLHFSPDGRMLVVGRLSGAGDTRAFLAPSLEEIAAAEQTDASSPLTPSPGSTEPTSHSQPGPRETNQPSTSLHRSAVSTNLAP